MLYSEKDEIEIFRSLYLEAMTSLDQSSQTAAFVISSDGRSYTKGVNNLPASVKLYPDRLERPSKYLYTEHAERAAVYEAARVGISTVGATMYALWAMCADCARAVICSGISEVVTHSFYTTRGHGQWDEHMTAAFTMLEEAGVKVRFVSYPLFPDSTFTLLFNGESVSF